MNCEKCQELLSDLLDGTLSAEQRAHIVAHLDECPACARVRDELSSIISTAGDCRAVLVALPNERALWLRIRNTIEAEAATAAAAAASRAARAASSPMRAGFWSRRLVLSLPQLATAVAGVAVAVALVTAFGMRALVGERTAPSAPNRPAARRVQQSPDELMMVEYLKRRIEERKSRWNPRMREAFEQNMSVIDATVSEMLQELDRRPHDEITEEALNAAMRDKIELLKEFSEL